MNLVHLLTDWNEELVEQGVKLQIIDETSRYYGGVIDPANGIPWPNHHAGTPVWMAVWTGALVNPESAYYRDQMILQRLELAADYMLRFQHEDGSISPGWTNFHSPPDTGFVIVGYAQLYLLLAKASWQAADQVCLQIRTFLERSIPVMLTGGCHTPNHRWVLCAALGYLYELFGDSRLLERANEWLAEGIDMTPDGEWTERSNGIYNAVSNVMLIHAARQLNHPELLEPVRRNLEMMMYLIHPSGEVVTDYSGRQDFGQIATMDNYMLAYYLMTDIDYNEYFAAMTELAAQAIKGTASSANNPLIGVLLYPHTEEPTIVPGTLPDHYRQMINGDFHREQYMNGIESAGHHNQIRYSRPHLDFGAPVLRMRHKQTSLTIMTETPSLLALRHGQVQLLGLQIASYFGPGFVPMQTLTETNSGYRLTGVYKKGYNSPISSAHLPLSTSSTVSPWYLLPHQHRLATHIQEYGVEVDIVEQINGMDLYFRSSTPTDVMTQLSFIFGKESMIQVEGEQHGQLQFVSEGIQFWKEGVLRIESGEDWMVLTGGASEHQAIGVREASYPDDCHTLLVNLMTPFEHKISIRLSPATNGSLQTEKNDIKNKQNQHIH